MQMDVYKFRTFDGILLAGDPRLRKISVKVEKNDFENETFKKNLSSLKHDLREFNKQMGFGRAVAAPQVGISRRFVVFSLKGEEKERNEFVMLNPIIYWKSEETVEIFDDCLSFPHLMVKLIRHKRISVEYENEKFEKVKMEKLPFSLSELIQHEIDHLDGILALDRALEKKDSIIYRENYEKYFKEIDLRTKRENDVDVAFQRIQQILLEGAYSSACSISEEVLLENSDSKIAQFLHGVSCSADEIFVSKNTSRAFQLILPAVVLVSNESVPSSAAYDSVIDKIFVSTVQSDLQNGFIDRGLVVSSAGVKFRPFNLHVKKLSYVANCMALMRRGEYEKAVLMSDKASKEFPDIYDWIQQISCQYIPFNTLDDFLKLYNKDGKKYVENFEMCYLSFIKENLEFFKFFYKLKIAHSVIKKKDKRARGWLNEARKDIKDFDWLVIEDYFGEKNEDEKRTIKVEEEKEENPKKTGNIMNEL